MNIAAINMQPLSSPTQEESIILNFQEATRGLNSTEDAALITEAHTTAARAAGDIYLPRWSRNVTIDIWDTCRDEHGNNIEQLLESFVAMALLISEELAA